MKKTILIFCTILFSTVIIAQQKPTELDKSPMDMSYWPKDFPLLKINGKVKDAALHARIIYGRPQKNNRTIFNGIIKYNEVWRLGANEATEIEFFKPVKIAGKTLAKGRYTMYCIPQEKKWTIIFNKDVFMWGSFVYDSKKDVVRTEVDVEKNNEIIEALSIYFEDSKTGANLLILWDDVKIALPISL